MDIPQASAAGLLDRPRELLRPVWLWLKEEGPYYATSFTAHLVILVAALLFLDLVTVDGRPVPPAPMQFQAANVEIEKPPPFIQATIEPLTPVAPQIDLENPGLEEGIAGLPPGGGDPNSNSDEGDLVTPAAGGGPNFEMTLEGAGPRPAPGGDFGPPGPGMPSYAYIHRTQGRHGPGGGFTKATERTLARSLNWFARHQRKDGGWSLGGFSQECKGAACTGAGNVESDAAATALALLPFLGAGHTHQTKQGTYQKLIDRGLKWLVEHQRPDGNLATPNHPQTMYVHALATIALCEAVGMTGDSALRPAAQKAIAFIIRAQNNATGGWRYLPGDELGDTSVVGWQVMALKSGQMAGLDVSKPAFDGAQRWLASVKKGQYGGQFAYLPTQGANNPMTAVGLLCLQYLGAKQGDPAVGEGTGVLFAERPSRSQKNVYAWYYMAQALHNYSGPEWDKWNREMRRRLVESQTLEGCAAGSWDPAGDAWGAPGGRLMVTSLCALTLEVEYRMLPLYKTEVK